jgi:hypothetical protein
MKPTQKTISLLLLSFLTVPCIIQNASAAIVFTGAVGKICFEESREFANSVEPFPCLLATLTIGGALGYTGTVLINDWGGKYRWIGAGIFVLDHPAPHHPDFVSRLKNSLPFVDDQGFFANIEDSIQEKIKIQMNRGNWKGSIVFSDAEIESLTGNLHLNPVQKSQILSILR